MPDEPREFALLCPHCGEENPPEFPVCWSCHRDLPAPSAAKGEPESTAAEPARAPRRARPQSKRIGLELARDPARRKRIAFEVAVAIAVVWLPWLAGGIWNAFNSFPPRSVSDALWDLVHLAGMLALLAYFGWIDGDWRRLLGLAPPRVVKELAWGAATFVALVVANSLAYRITLVLDLADGPPPRGAFAPEARWLAPLCFLIGALVEEAFYRAYLWNRLTELSGRPTLSMILASVLFSAGHVYPLPGSLSILFLGLTFACIFRARPSLWPLVLAHWAYNLFVAA